MSLSSPHASLIIYVPATSSANCLKSTVNTIPLRNAQRVLNPESGSEPSFKASAHLALISGEMKPIPSQVLISISFSIGSLTLGHSGFSPPVSLTIFTTSLNFVNTSLTTMTLGHGTGILAEH